MERREVAWSRRAADDPGARDGSQAVHRALRVLTAFLELPGPYVALVDLARHCRLSPSTTHRLVAALVDEGYLAQDRATSRYYLGARVLQLGRRAVQELGMAQRALPVMRGLAQSEQASVNLGVLQQDQAVYIQKVESPQALQLNLPVGTTVPVYCTAIGKVLAAHLPERARRALLSRLRLEPLQRNTITDPEALWQEWQRVRHAGYAIDNEEFLAGVICLGVPIRVAGEVVAAMALQYPKVHLEPGGILSHLPNLQRAAREVEVLIGGRLPE